MIAVIDYGAGNLRSVVNALTHLRVDHTICDSPHSLIGATGVILPGVGHFGAAAKRLTENGVALRLADLFTEGVPILGICLGMQLLFETSDEAPTVSGLGFWKGRSVKLKSSRVPHMGWNNLSSNKECPLLEPESPKPFYFAHSFLVQPSETDVISATVSDGDVTFPAIVGRDRCWGVQFHPEKSDNAGLALLSRFAAWC